MLTPEQAQEMHRLIDQISCDTDPQRLNYIASELIQLSRDMYPRLELVQKAA